MRRRKITYSPCPTHTPSQTRAYPAYVHDPTPPSPSQPAFASPRQPTRSACRLHHPSYSITRSHGSTTLQSRSPILTAKQVPNPLRFLPKSSPVPYPEREVFRRMRVSRHEQRFPIPSPISPACPLCPPQNRDNAFLLVTANRARVARVHPPSVHVAFNRSRERFPRRAKRESQRVKKSEKIVAERQLLLYFLFQRCFGGARTDFVFPV